MRRVFVDCGYSDGIATRFFRYVHPKSRKFAYHGFECDPGLTPVLEKGKLINKAVWTYDGETKFGSKENVDPIKVPCIDFANWIKMFDIRDCVIVKMNIAGAEYAVLEHLMNDRPAMLRIKLFYISWHWNKIGMTKQKHDKIRNKLWVPHYNWGLAGENDFERYKPSFLNSLRNQNV